MTMTIGNHTRRVLVVLALALHAGCMDTSKSAKSDQYWASGCITPDGRRMAFAGSEVVLMDLQNGKILQRSAGYYDSIVCFEAEKVAALSSRQALWIAEKKTVKRAGSWTPIGITGPGEFAVYERTLASGGMIRSWSGPMQVAIETLNGADTVATPLSLSAAHFTSIGNGPDTFLETMPIRILDDGRLLIAAGFTMTSLSNTRPWRLFAVNIKSHVVTPVGPERRGDNEFSMFDRLAKFAATHDGAFVAGSTARAIVVLRSDEANEISRIRLSGVREIQTLALNAEGTIVAAGITSQDGQGRVAVFDTAAGNKLWETNYDRGLIHALQFLSDGSLIVMQSGSGNRIVSRRNGTDGKVVWLIND